MDFVQNVVIVILSFMLRKVVIIDVGKYRDFSWDLYY